MTRLLRAALAGTIAALLVLGAGAPAGAADGDAPERTARKVLVFTMPATRWADIAEHRPPVLLDLLDRSAVGTMSLRTVGSAATLGRSYATIGAGNRAMADDQTAGQAFAADELLENSSAADVLARRCRCDPGDAAAVHVAAPEVTAINDRLDYGAVPGALAEVLDEAGMTVAVVGNADGSLEEPGVAAHREVALTAMDPEGRVTAGTVGSELLLADDDAPFGVRTDIDAASTAFEEAWEASDVVVLEASDLERADRYAPAASPAAARAAKAEALAAADELLAEALEHVDPERDLVMVVGPTDPRPLPVETSIGAIAGPGIDPGLATSGTTRRPGYLTLPAVASTALDVLGIEVPSTMQGGVISSVGGERSPRELVEELAEDNELSVFRNRVVGPISTTFVLLQVATYVLAGFAIVTRRLRLLKVVRLLALTVVALPSVAFLSGVVEYHELGAAAYTLAFFAGGVLLALLARAGARVVRDHVDERLRPLVAPVALIALIYLILLADIAIGGPLQMNTVFGYNPIIAGRFAGYGNLAFSLATSAAVVLGASCYGIAVLVRDRAWTGPRHRGALAAVAVLFAVTTVALGFPRLGMNVGATLSSVPAFIVTALLLAGVAVTWRRMAAIGAATLVVIGSFAAFDLSRPPENRAHLGRFVALVLDQGGAGFLTVIERKASANLGILMSSVWAFLVPAGLVFLAVLAWREPAMLRAVRRRFPPARAALVGVLVAGTLGALLNDSGVAIPAMMFSVLLPFITILVAAVVEDEGAEAVTGTGTGTEPTKPAPERGAVDVGR